MALRTSFDTSSVLEHPAGEEIRKERWPVQFPVENGRDGYSWKAWHLVIASLLLAWLGGLLQGVSGGTLEMNDPVLQELFEERTAKLRWIAGWTVAPVLLMAAMNVSDLYVRGLWKKVPTAVRTMAMWICFIAVLALQLFLPGIAAIVAVVYLLFHATRFREHYVAVSSGGLLDEKNRTLFRRTGRVACEVGRGPLLPAFCDAIRSWTEYNRSEVQLPGLLQSPAGTMCQRVFASCLASYLLGHAVLYLLAERSTLVAELRGQMLFLEAYQAAVVLLAACGPIAALTLCAYLGALLAVSFPILRMAKALKDSAFAPGRWDAFLDDLEFNDHVTD